MRQNHLVKALRDVSVLPEGAMPSTLLAGMMPSIPLVRPAFGTRPTFYMPPAASIRRPDDMLSLPLGQHILDYETLYGFSIPAFAMFDG